MRTRNLAGLQVSAIGMGSAQTFDVHSREDIEVRRKIMDRCLEKGVTFIDTSPMYGRAERVLGETMDGRAHKFCWRPRYGVPARRRAAPRLNALSSCSEPTISIYFRFIISSTGAPTCLI